MDSFGAEGWDPARTNTVANLMLQKPVFDLLFSMDKGKLAPSLVEKWEIAPDGLSWTYYIRKGVKFHNGDDLSAKDVKFTLDRYMSKEAFFSDLRNAGDRVDQVDNYTVRVFTKGPQPFVPYMSTHFSPSQGLVQPMDYINKNGLDFFRANPVGSGPFKFVSYVVGDNAQFEANTKYWGKLPAFQRLSILLIPEETTKVAMLKTGALDAAALSLDTSVQLEKQGYTQYQLFAEQPRLQISGTYDPRSKGMPTADIRVRQALNLAINRDEISKTLFYGKTGHLMPPGPIFYGQDDIDSEYWLNQSKKYYRYDPTEAKRLLAEAGYPGAFSNPTIKIYSFTPPGSPYVPKLNEIVQAQWQAIGVKAAIAPVDYSTWNSWTVGTTDQVMGAVSITRGPTLAPAPNLIRGTYYSAGTHKLVNATGKSMIPELDGLFDSALRETNAEKRKELIARAMQMAMDTYTAFPFPTVPSMVAVGPNVKFDFQYPLVHQYLTSYAEIAQHAK